MKDFYVNFRWVEKAQEIRADTEELAYALNTLATNASARMGADVAIYLIPEEATAVAAWLRGFADQLEAAS